MPHPLLQRADVDAVLQMAGGIGVAEFVKEPSAAVRPLPAPVDPDGAVVELVRHRAVAAVELAAVRDGLELFQHGAVGASGTT